MERWGRVLGQATTNFNDYVGTVAADDGKAVLDRRSIYELAQIDHDRYAIVAVELKVDGHAAVSVYAIDRVEHGISLNDEIVELGRSTGQIPVVQFNVPERNVAQFVRQAFPRISAQLVLQDLRGQLLVVTEASSIERLSA
jgi:hypothetical protein